jgi:cytochrome P450
MFHHLSVDASRWTSAIDLSPLFFRFTIDASFEFLFGESVHSQNAALPADSPFKRHVASRAGFDPAYVAQCFDSAAYTIGQRIPMNRLYWLYSPRSLRQHVKVVQGFADYYVDRILHDQKAPAATGDEKKEKYIFLRELAKQTQDPIELRSSLLHLLLAGRDTTAGLLGYVWWNLARHPEVFRKLRETIIERFGTPSSPKEEITFANLKSCSYLQHVLSETLRLYPSVPITSRRALRDTTLPRGGGPDGTSPIYVRQGTEINYPVYVMHRRTDLWGPDAAEWKPSRWEGKRPSWEFLPFNGGPRICLGQQFALTQAGYVTVRMVQRFDRVENLDLEALDKPFHSMGLTAAPAKVLVKLHEAEA